jgi:microtubule-associated protein-like 5
LINALELFSGLIIFAESKFEEKARFLFDLFDFNELNSLSLVIIVINDIYFLK